MIKSKAQHKFYRQIQGTDHPFAEGAAEELKQTKSSLGLPERVHKVRKRQYVPRPTTRKPENKEVVHGT